MTPSQKFALFTMLGRSTQKSIREAPGTAPKAELMISATFNVAEVLPEETKEAVQAAETFKLRDFILKVLSEADKDNWWEAIPLDVRDEVAKLENTEDQKRWMNLDSRGKLSLTTLPQLIRIMDEPGNWKKYFEPLVRDKGLLQQTRLIGHNRNTICHMATVSEEEHERVRQVMRDWFRVIAP